MAITPECDACGTELDTFGGIVLSPPNDENKVTKYHVCKDCFDDINSMMKKNA